MVKVQIDIHRDNFLSSKFFPLPPSIYLILSDLFLYLRVFSLFNSHNLPTPALYWVSLNCPFFRHHHKLPFALAKNMYFDRAFLFFMMMTETVCSEVIDDNEDEDDACGVDGNDDDDDDDGVASEVDGAAA